MSGVMDNISDILTNPDDLVIKPVVDLTDIQNGANKLDSLFANRTYALAGANAGFSDEKFSELNAAIDMIQKTNDARGAEIANAIAELRGDFDSLIDAINNMDITLDSGAVVGGLINKIDIALGQVATYKGRGN